MKQILLLEDDELIREAFALVFKEPEFKLVAIDRGEKIIDGNIEVPDLFILDKQVSGINGLDVCRFIRSQEALRHVPIIIISACPNISQLAKEAGADEALMKPFSLRQLREMVQRHLRN